jgi:hypothetical protein
MKRFIAILAVLLALVLLAVPASACNGVQLLQSNVCAQPALVQTQFVQYVQPFVSTVQFAVVQPQVIVQPAVMQRQVQVQVQQAYAVPVQQVAVQSYAVAPVIVQQNVVAARVRQRIVQRNRVLLPRRSVVRQRTVIR